MIVDEHITIHTYIFSKPIILTQDPQKHRNSSKFLIRKFSPLQSFLFEKAINGVQYMTFPEACLALGLIDDDEE